MKDGFKGSRSLVIPESIVREMENDPFESRLHITDIGYYPMAYLHNRKRPNGTSCYVLIYCMEGEGAVKIGGDKYNLQRDQLIILPANIAHEYATSKTNPWTIYWIHFNGTFAEFYSKDFYTPTSIAPSEKSRIYDRLVIFEDIFTALGYGLNRDNIDYAISALYYFLGSIKFLNVYREVSCKQDSKKNIIDKALLYIRENIEKTIALKDIAQYVGYSGSYFLTFFKRQMNDTPVNYIIQMKMQEACKMLDLTDMKVNQIGYKIGFKDPYYFTRQFTKEIGVSPSKYRKIKRGEAK